MNVLQHTRNERNPYLKQNRPDRSYRATLLSLFLNNGLVLWFPKKLFLKMIFCFDKESWSVQL